jgi:hypothetical protein
VWGNLAVDPRTAPSKGVALVTYNTWFSSSACIVHSVHGTGASAGGPEADLGDVHWRPTPCIITADNIPHSHLISPIKLRTISHGLNIEMLRHTVHVLVSREQAERVLGVTTALVRCMMSYTVSWSAPTHFSCSSEVPNPLWGRCGNT